MHKWVYIHWRTVYMMSCHIAAKVGPALFFWRLLCLHHHCGARPSHLNGIANDQNMINNTGTIILSHLGSADKNVRCWVMLAVTDVTQMSQHTCYLTHTIRLNSWIRLTLSHHCQSRLTVQLQIWATLKPHSHCYLKISPLILVWFGTNFQFCSDFLSWGKNSFSGPKMWGLWKVNP